MTCVNVYRLARRVFVTVILQNAHKINITFSESGSSDFSPLVKNLHCGHSVIADKSNSVLVNKLINALIFRPIACRPNTCYLKIGMQLLEFTHRHRLQLRSIAYILVSMQTLVVNDGKPLLHM